MDNVVPKDADLQTFLFLLYMGVFPSKRLCFSCTQDWRPVPARKGNVDTSYPVVLEGNSACDTCGRANRRWRRPCHRGVTKETFLENMPYKNLGSYLEFLMMWALRYPMRIMCAELPGLHDDTLRQWQTYLQELCMIDCVAGGVAERLQIGGLDENGERIEVQADETLINKRKPSILARVARPQAHLVWLWGAVESRRADPNFVFQILRSPDDAADGRPRGKKELWRCISECIRPGTKLVTDGWRAYTFMPWEELDIEWSFVNHSREFVNWEGEHTNRIEGQWSVLKRWLRERYSGRLPDPNVLYLYLFEFVWRRGRQHPFYDILKAMEVFYGEDLPVGDSRQEFVERCLAAAEAGASEE